MNEWLGIVPKKNTDYFRVADYESLHAIDSVIQEDGASKRGGGNRF